MHGDKISAFAERIVRIDGLPPGFIGMAEGLGAISPRQAVVLDAKHKVLNLTAELRKKNPNRAKLIQLFEQMEGSLQGLRTFAVIDSHRLSELMSELKQLRTAALRR